MKYQMVIVLHTEDPAEIAQAIAAMTMWGPGLEIKKIEMKTIEKD